MSTVNIVIPLSDEGLYKQTCDEKYVSKIRVHSSILSRPMEWFTRHKKALLDLAHVLFKNDFKNVTLSERIKNILFDRVVKQYCASAKSGDLNVVITQGCCQSNKGCILVVFQRALLVAIRTKVREEEDVWPHDL
jgi:hypothetical protein